jgi:hypothetical protein
MSHALSVICMTMISKVIISIVVISGFVSVRTSWRKPKLSGMSLYNIKLGHLVRKDKLMFSIRTATSSVKNKPRFCPTNECTFVFRGNYILVKLHARNTWLKWRKGLVQDISYLKYHVMPKIFIIVTNLSYLA